MRRKGWFKIPGVQDGDRTAQEQLVGLKWALDGAHGKRVLDIGCAEGLIAMEFLRRGAKVLGVDSVEAAIDVARELCPGGDFIVGRLEEMIERENGPDFTFDIVLALSVVNKLRNPEAAFPALKRWTKPGGLCVLRLPAPKFVNSHIPLFSQRDAPALMRAAGFTIEREEQGARGEWVAYWRG